MIQEARSKIKASSRREKLLEAVQYIHKNFRYDSWALDNALSQSADYLFQTRILGGCSDYALAHVSLFRALGIPARIVLSVNVDWMRQVKKNRLLIPRGHVFIEAFLEDGWVLCDPIYKKIYEQYDPDKTCLPRKEYFFARGKDYWDVGLKDITGLAEKYRSFADKFDEDQYIPPHYPVVDIPPKAQDSNRFIAFFRKITSLGSILTSGAVH